MTRYYLDHTAGATSPCGATTATPTRIDDDTVCVSREDLAEVLWHAHITPTHAAEAAVRLWTSSDDWQGALASCPDQEATR